MRVNQYMVSSDLPDPYILHRFEDQNGDKWSAIYKQDIEVMCCKRNQEPQMFIEFYDYLRSMDRNANL